MKKTGWFPSDVKPVHVGLYETKANKDQIKRSPWLWYWTGRYWTMAGVSEIPATVQARVWRGLTKETK